MKLNNFIILTIILFYSCSNKEFEVIILGKNKVSILSLNEDVEFLYKNKKVVLLSNDNNIKLNSEIINEFPPLGPPISIPNEEIYEDSDMDFYKNLPYSIVTLNSEDFFISSDSELIKVRYDNIDDMELSKCKFQLKKLVILKLSNKLSILNLCKFLIFLENNSIKHISVFFMKDVASF